MSTWDLEGVRHVVLVCTGSSCRKHGGDGVVAAVKADVKELGLRGDVHVVRSRCLGRCDDACNLVVMPEGTWYAGLGAKSARRVVREHLAEGRPVEEHVAYDRADGRMRKVGGGKRGKPRK